MLARDHFRNSCRAARWLLATAGTAAVLALTLGCSKSAPLAAAQSPGNADGTPKADLNEKRPTQVLASESVPEKSARFVTVVLREVAVSPTKRGGADGPGWDVGAKIPKEGALKLAAALAKTGDPYATAAAVVVALSPYVGGVVAGPEIAGKARLWQHGRTVGPLKVFNMSGPRDAFHVPVADDAGAPVQWTRVDLDSDPRIVGDLWDNDGMLSKRDPIGTFEIRRTQLIEALQDLGNAQPYPVVFDDGAVLFIRISVMDERG